MYFGSIEHSEILFSSPYQNQVQLIIFLSILLIKISTYFTLNDLTIYDNAQAFWYN